MSAKKVGPNRRLEYILMAIGTIPSVTAVMLVQILMYWNTGDMEHIDHEHFHWLLGVVDLTIVAAILWFALFALIIRVVIDKNN